VERVPQGYIKYFGNYLVESVQRLVERVPSRAKSSITAFEALYALAERGPRPGHNPLEKTCAPLAAKSWSSAAANLATWRRADWSVWWAKVA
jgi:hypothetical protein